MSGAHEGNSIGDDLYRWWMDLASEEAEAAAAKADEYGSNSMTELGHDLSRLHGHGPISDAQATELACYFYIKGKMGRWFDAILADRSVSDDTVADIGVYARMVQRVRSNGGWPGAPTGQEVTDETQGVGPAPDEFLDAMRQYPGVGIVVGMNLNNGKTDAAMMQQDTLPGWEGTD